MNLGDLLRGCAAKYPDVTALYCGDRTISYAELNDSTERLAGWLLREGLKPGDRVALQWPNAIETVQLYFALFKAGMIAVPVNLRLKPAEIAWVAENSGASLWFGHPMLAAAARAAGIEVHETLPDLSSLPDAGPLPPADPSKPAAIIYTSGSTGKPKGAVHSHISLSAAARISTDGLVDSLLRFEGFRERALMMTPIMHVSGMYVVLAAMWVGHSCVLLPTFEPGAALEAIERYRCTTTLALPVLMQMLLEEQSRKARDVSSLKVVFAGGDSVPVSLQNRVREVMGVEMLEGLAQTETGPAITNPIEAPRPGSVGKVMKGVEVRLVDTAGQEVAEGQPGEMLVRSAGLCVGYWENPAATAEALVDGWFRTGDLVSRDEDGYYWFRGRLKEIIIRGGSNISPQEVEEVLYQHPDVLEAGVVGAPHPVWGEQVVAFVVLREGVTEDAEAIRSHARTVMADYKVPEQVHFLPVLPKGATGKVHRKALKDQLAGDTGGSGG